MGLTPRRLAILALAAGFLLVCVGTALIFPPLALIVAGLGLGAIGFDELRSR